MDIKKMSLRDKVLQTAVVLIDKENFVTEKVGGIYVGAAVCEHNDELGLEKVRNLVKKYHENADYPLLVCSDFEHGCGNIRGLTHFPHFMAVGAANNEKISYDYGYATGIEGLSVGANWAFAPVCDIDFTGKIFHHATERNLSLLIFLSSV